MNNHIEKTNATPLTHDQETAVKFHAEIDEQIHIDSNSETSPTTQVKKSCLGSPYKLSSILSLMIQKHMTILCNPMTVHIRYLQGLPIGLAEMRDADYAYITTVLTVAGEIASSGLHAT
jgi:hypothetical protein